MRLCAILACLVLASCEAPLGDLPQGTRELAHGAMHWAEWIELTPAIRTPHTQARNDRTKIFVRLPRGAEITLAVLADRRSLRVPSGTEIDRVEFRRVRSAMKVVDVRGTRFEHGRETFRAYRPIGVEEVDRLFGVEWSRGDDAQASQAIASMRMAMEHGFGFVPRGAERHRVIARYERLMQCAGCHQQERPERRFGPSEGPRRATDASGLYTLLATLENDARVETYRPVDANDGRPVTRTCEDGSVPSPRCDDGSAPRARLDVHAGIESRDPSTLALCASRRSLAPFLSQEVRLAYAPELAECEARAPATITAAATLLEGEP